jgi:hypothetical protein
MFRVTEKDAEKELGIKGYNNRNLRNIIRSLKFFTLNQMQGVSKRSGRFQMLISLKITYE